MLFIKLNKLFIFKVLLFCSVMLPFVGTSNDLENNIINNKQNYKIVIDDDTLYMSLINNNIKYNKVYAKIIIYDFKNIKYLPELNINYCNIENKLKTKDFFWDCVDDKILFSRRRAPNSLWLISRIYLKSGMPVDLYKQGYRIFSRKPLMIEYGRGSVDITREYYGKRTCEETKYPPFDPYKVCKHTDNRYFENRYLEIVQFQDLINFEYYEQKQFFCNIFASSEDSFYFYFLAKNKMYIWHCFPWREKVNKNEITYSHSLYKDYKFNLINITDFNSIKDFTAVFFNNIHYIIQNEGKVIAHSFDIKDKTKFNQNTPLNKTDYNALNVFQDYKETYMDVEGNMVEGDIIDWLLNKLEIFQSNFNNRTEVLGDAPENSIIITDKDIKDFYFLKDDKIIGKTGDELFNLSHKWVYFGNDQDVLREEMQRFLPELQLFRLKLAEEKGIKLPKQERQMLD